MQANLLLNKVVNVNNSVVTDDGHLRGSSVTLNVEVISDINEETGQVVEFDVLKAALQEGLLKYNNKLLIYPQSKCTHELIKSVDDKEGLIKIESEFFQLVVKESSVEIIADGVQEYQVLANEIVRSVLPNQQIIVTVSVERTFALIDGVFDFGRPFDTMYFENGELHGDSGIFAIGGSVVTDKETGELTKVGETVRDLSVAISNAIGGCFLMKADSLDEKGNYLDTTTGASLVLSDESANVIRFSAAISNEILAVNLASELVEELKKVDGFNIQDARAVYLYVSYGLNDGTIVPLDRLIPEEVTLPTEQYTQDIYTPEVVEGESSMDVNSVDVIDAEVIEGN